MTPTLPTLGNDKPTRRTWINGKSFWTRQNPWDFLISARERRCSSSLWIDALCIDQWNVDERNHQVQQMSEVFSHAQRVFAWLGDDKHIIGFLVKVDHTRGLDTGHSPFYGAPNWSRTWTTHGVALAQQVILATGRQKLPLRLLALQSWNRRDRSLPGQTKLECSLVPTFKDCVTKASSFFFIRYKIKESHNLRNRVFSLLPLCGKGRDMEVNYRLSRRELAGRVITSAQERSASVPFA